MHDETSKDQIIVLLTRDITLDSNTNYISLSIMVLQTNAMTCQQISDQMSSQGSGGICERDFRAGVPPLLNSIYLVLISPTASNPC